ncbi:hypothetical protein Hanom_Chr06g00523991 [Helianthus anomalus]
MCRLLQFAHIIPFSLRLLNQLIIYLLIKLVLPAQYLHTSSRLHKNTGLTPRPSMRIRWLCATRKKMVL